MDFPFLKKTSLWDAFSPLGRRMHTPSGIFYWSGRAKNEAEIDGTIGVAQDDDGTISHLKIAESWAGEKVMERVPQAKVFGYAPIPGIESLRKKWLSFILGKHPVLKNFATIPVVTNGITHGLAIAARLFLSAGETIITADKSWENYKHIFTDTQGIKILAYPLFRDDGNLHVDAMIGSMREVAVSQKKVILLLNFPHNQTGYMPSSSECVLLGNRIHQLVREMPDVSFVLLLDDAYEGYIYDEKGQKHSLLSELFAQLPNLTIVKLDGISKAMLAYGYRVAFITLFLNSLNGAPFSEDQLRGMREEVSSKIGGFIRGEISQVNHHGQILADALMDDFTLVEEQKSIVVKKLSERWLAMTEALSAGYAKYGKEKLWADPCNGGFFCYLNLAKGLDAKEIADRLMKEKKVGVVPGDQGLRVAFAGVPKEKIGKMIKAIFDVVHTFHTYSTSRI